MRPWVDYKYSRGMTWTNLRYNKQHTHTTYKTQKLPTSDIPHSDKRHTVYMLSVYKQPEYIHSGV